MDAAAARRDAATRPQAATPGWRVAAARLRGEIHARRGERGQDALRLRLPRPGLLVAALADGAGSAPRGGAGAALACRAAVAAALHAEAGPDRTDPDLAACVGSARAAVIDAAARRGLAARDLASTLLLAVSDGRTTATAHVGDGAIVARGPEGWRALSWPEAGAHAGETRFLTDETLALRIARCDGPIDALALLTDGVERLVLDFANRTPHAPFFERMAAPVAALPAPGRDAALSRALGRYLASEAVAARSDDDRTLLVATLAP